MIDARPLLLGPEPDSEMAVARARRLKRVMTRVQEIVGEGKELRLREQSGNLIITAPERTLRQVSKAINEMTRELLLDTE